MVIQAISFKFPFVGISSSISAEQLQSAISCGDVEAIKKLTSSCDVNQPLPNKELPIRFAVRSRQVSAAIALVEAGADPFAKDAAGLSALESAVLMDPENSLVALLQTDRACSSKEVLAVAALPEYCQNAQRSLQEILHFQESEKMPDLSPRLLLGLENGASILDKSMLPCGVCAIHIAAMKSSPDAIEFLIRHGANLNAKDRFGRTALHYAAANGDAAILGSLIKAGASVAELDCNCTTAMGLFIAAVREKCVPHFSLSEKALLASGLTAIYIMNRYPFNPNLEGAIFAGIGVAASAVTIGKAKGVLRKGLQAGISVVQVLPVWGVPARIWQISRVASREWENLKQFWNVKECRTKKMVATLVAQHFNLAAACVAGIYSLFLIEKAILDSMAQMPPPR